MTRKPLLVAIVLGLVASAAIADAATTFPSTFKIYNSPEQNGLVAFKIKVISDAQKCVQNRKVKFAKRPQGTNDPFVVVAQGFTDDHGRITRSLNVKNNPDVKVTAVEKTFGKPGNRKTCLARSHIINGGTVGPS